MKWLFILLLLISIGATAQTDDSTRYIYYPAQYGMRMPRLWADSVLHIPLLDTAQLIKKDGTKARAGALVCRPQDKLIYRWDGDKWGLLGGEASTPTDWSYITVESDCHDTTFLNASGDLIGNYEQYSLPQFIGLRLRVSAGGLQLPADDRTGWYFTWNNTTGILRIYSMGTCEDAGSPGQQRLFQGY